MFPNPQDALPLPVRPDVARYRKLAKELVKACRSATEPDDGAWAARWSRAWIETLVRLSGIQITPQLPVRVDTWIEEVAGFARRQLRGADGSACALADAQFVIARSHGFASWPKFVRHLEALQSAGSFNARFEAAADAIVAGDSVALRRLLKQDPRLVTARSGREHGAALLHYVSANGVEGYRQRTPANALEIACMLLDAGAEVDATAQVYGADCSTLELTATSGHPERARVQMGLMALLLERGARLEPSLLESCLANGRVAAAEFLAERLDQRGVSVGLVAAAGLGWLDGVQRSIAAYGSPNLGELEARLRRGLLFASQFGRDAVVEFLLARGVPLEAADARGQTALHHAVIGGNPATVRLLLGHHAPLDAVNSFGGTPLGQALWSAAHGGDAAAYAEIVEALTKAAAELSQRR